MRVIATFEAEGRLGELIDRVEPGDEVVITRHGRAVAKLVPAGAGIDRSEARAAAERIRARRRGATLGGLKIRDLIDEGRR